MKRRRQLKTCWIAVVWLLLILLSTATQTTAAAVSPRKLTFPSIRRRKVQHKPSPSKQVVVGTASIPNEIFNLVKSIVGAGVLGLPAGIAAFGDSPVALVPAYLLVLCIGMASGYGFSLMGRVCATTGATSYREAWSMSVSPKSSWIPATACLLVTSCTVLAYSIILADTMPQLLSSIINWRRIPTLVLTTTCILLPLCLLRNLKSLAPFSILGITGMVYTAIAMAIRYWKQDYAPVAVLWTSLPQQLQPNFATTQPQSLVETFTNPQLVVFVCMLSSAFMAHYNAPKFYWELQNNTLPRFQIVVLSSFGISILLFITIASLGFLTFGQASDALILNNYSTADTIMSASRFAVTMSILASYPLAFVGVRDGVLDFVLQVPSSQRTGLVMNSVTLGLLAVITALACVVDDLKLLLALVGATWGNAVIYLFPTFMFLKSSKKQGESTTTTQKMLAVLTGIMGLVVGSIGTTMVIKSITASNTAAC